MNLECYRKQGEFTSRAEISLASARAPQHGPEQNRVPPIGDQAALRREEKSPNSIICRPDSWPHTSASAIPIPSLARPVASLFPTSAGRGETDIQSIFKAGKQAKNKNQHERSRYVYENKKNTDNLPEKKADILCNRTLPAWHFMHMVSPFAGSNALLFVFRKEFTRCGAFANHGRVAAAASDTTLLPCPAAPQRAPASRGIHRHVATPSRTPACERWPVQHSGAPSRRNPAGSGAARRAARRANYGGTHLLLPFMGFLWDY